MSLDVLNRIQQIRSRVEGIQARFGAPAPHGAFAGAMDQAASKPESPAATGQAAAHVPGPYGGALAQAAARHDVDPALVRAVMTAESGGNPQAKSPVGALGLMQLMPATARDLGVADPLDPRQNLEGGAKYLGELTKRYGLERGVAAYNAGPGAVEKHGGVPPYPETQHYVEKVLGLYQQFKAAPPAAGTHFDTGRTQR